MGSEQPEFCSSVKALKQNRYKNFLPNISESGARISGPILSIATYPVWHAIPELSVVFRDSAICWMLGVDIEIAKGLRTVYM